MVNKKTEVRCRSCGTFRTVTLDVRGTMAHRRAFVVQVPCEICGGTMREVMAGV